MSQALSGPAREWPKYASTSSIRSTSRPEALQEDTTVAGQYAVSKAEELQSIIAVMRRSIPELHGAMIASADGLAIAHDFPDADAERTAAMAATALGLGTRISERTNLGTMAEAVIRGQDGYLVVYSAGDEAALVLSGPIDSNLGLMRIEARAASVRVATIFGRA